MRGRATARTASFPAPVGGLNARDSLAAMKPTDAVVLENWFPTPTSVDIRKGYTPWATGFVNPVQALMKYAPTTGAYKLFAAAGTSFFDATANGAIGAAVVTGLANAQWCYTNIVTPGGSYLWVVNGQDNGKLYDGTTWADVSITGVASSSIAQVNVFGNRLFLIEKNKLKVWYLAVQSIAGAATAFDLSTIFARGGYLMAMGTWSLDAGNGLNDLAVFVSSEGEVAIYQGIDPTTWTKQGVFYVGRPIGRKCSVKMGGDFLLLCEQGIYPLSRALLSASVDRRVALTDKIQNIISQAVFSYENNYGWQMTVYPEQNQLWLNVPTGNNASVQYVMNTITSAWCKFTNMNAGCWESVGPDIYFGGTTAVYKAWSGQFDNAGQVQADALQAYSNFKTEAQQKYFTMVRPSIVADGNPSILFGLNTDFLNQPATGALSLNAPPTGMVWGATVWGPPSTSMTWGGGLLQISAWQTVGAIAHYAALRLTVQANGSIVSWNEVSHVYQPGGIL
jgi:hypothetical protein